MSQAEPEASPAAEGALPSSARVLGVGRRKDARRVPALVLASVLLVRQAAPRLFAQLVAMQAAVAVGVAARLLVARQLLRHVEREGVQGDAPNMVRLALLLLALTAVMSALGLVLQERQRLLEEEVERAMQGQVLDIAGTAELTAYETPEFYDQLQRAQYGVSFRPFQVASGLAGVLSGSLATGAVLVAVGVVLPVLVPLMVLGYLPLWFVTRRNSRAAVEFEVAYTERERKRGYLSEVLTEREHAKEVRANGTVRVLRSWYEQLYDERLRWLHDLSRSRLRRALTAQLISLLAAGLALTVLLAGVGSGRLTGTAAGVAALAVLELGNRLSGLYGGAGRLLEGALFLDDFQDFQARYGGAAQTAQWEDLEGDELEPPVAQRTATVEARDVHFTYPGAAAEALRGIDLTIAPGEFVALVGENGSGKTTLATLVAGLHMPSSGELLVNGLDVRSWPLPALRRVVATVFQDFARYELTLGENVGLGDPGRLGDVQAVRAAAERVGADQLAQLLPDGYSTLLGKRFFGGHELSVGQWQKVALARAFLRDAPLLVLDEPTASLDPLAEAQVFDAVRELAQDRAVLFVSHRFSTVRSASRILVMDRGRLVEQGDHDALMAQRGVYRRLYETQAAPFR